MGFELFALICSPELHGIPARLYSRIDAFEIRGNSENNFSESGVDVARSGHSTFGNLDSELEQFSVNSWCTPAQIGFGHRLHEFSDIGAPPRSTWILVPG